MREVFSNHRLTLNVIYEESDKVLAGEVPLPVGFEILRGAGFDDSFVVAKTPLLEDAIDDAYATSDGPSVHIQLTGDFTIKEAEDLATVLRAGGVPWPLVFENGHFMK